MKKLFLLAMVLGLLAVGCAETGKWVCKGQCNPFETSLALVEYLIMEPL